MNEKEIRKKYLCDITKNVADDRINLFCWTSIKLYRQTGGYNSIALPGND